MERKGFIGGSDAVRIMQGDWLKLWQIKTGREEPEDLSNNFTVQSGVHNEAFILNWFEKQYTLELTGYQKHFRVVHNGVPLKGTIDAEIKNQKAIIEAKETYDYNTMEKQLERYMPQIQFYLALSKLDTCYFANKFGNRRWECITVQKYLPYIDGLMSQIYNFWQYVINDECPETNLESKQIDNANNVLVNNMIRRNGSKDNYFTTLADEYVKSQLNAKDHDATKKELKTLIADNERELYCDKLSLRRDKRGSIRIIVNQEVTQ